MEKQETITRHSGRMKRRAEEVSAGDNQKHTHGRATSLASGVGLKPVTASPIRRRITLAVRRDNVSDARGSARPDLEHLFERNRELLTNYLAALEGGGHALPGHPKSSGAVLFPQVEAEAGLPVNSLATPRPGEGESDRMRLRGVIQGAAERLGVELRVLPRSPHATATPLTYAQLLERGRSSGSANCKVRGASASSSTTPVAL
jgi:hypothetical protein